MHLATLITGASAGIGRSLAHEFARHGHHLVLVARGEENLDQLAAELRLQHQVQVETISCDLELPHAAEEIAAALKERDIEIDNLVNNAGRAMHGFFHEVDLDDHHRMIDLNIRALVDMTWAFLPEMIRRGRGKILQLGSIASFQPGPRMAVYHATKAFVLSFSEAVAEEVKDHNITVTVLCPGPTDTDFFPRAEMEDTRVYQEMDLADPDEVARKGYEALMNGERVIIPGGFNKAMTFGRRLLPKSVQARLNEVFYQEV